MKNGSLHLLRHTFASRLVQNGASIYAVSKLLCHANIKTTMNYAHLSPEHLNAAVMDKLFML
ncbi:MAG: tyrosine-type recombinase/integrase [Endomicrobium sp.]|nr:tyrosine-type recombinase/integrase [Endomicrobium sp.]